MIDRVAQRKNQRKADRLARKLNEKYPGIPTIGSFKKLPAHLKTRKKWYRKFDRKVLPKEKPKGIVLWKHEENLGEGARDSESNEIIWTFRPEVITTPVPVFAVDQTTPVRKHARTKALEEYWDFFCSLTNRDYKVVYLPSGECRTWEGKITRDEARDHFLGRREFAVRMSKRTFHVGIDHDLHAGNPDVFLRQFDVLLNTFWAKDTWHLQVKRANAGGVHFLRVFSTAQETSEVVSDIRAILIELDDQHPELAADAVASGMKPFTKMEIKPTEGTALRLPLAPGRVMLLDCPLETIIYRKKCEQDIAGYIEWLNEALEGQTQHMPKDDVRAFVKARLSYNREEIRYSTPIIVPPQNSWPQQPPSTAEMPQKPPSCRNSSRTRRMKGRSWRLITDAWTGPMQPDSLNHWIRQLSLYAPCHFQTEDAAVQTIEKFIDELPDWSFSDRLASGQRSKVSAVIRRDVQMAFTGWQDQPDPQSSAKKLKAVWERWTSTGRNLFEKRTWEWSAAESLQGSALADDFEFTPIELGQLKSLSSLLAADPDQIEGAVKHLIRLIRVHPEVPRTWVVQILEGQGIKARSKKLDKPKVLIDFLLKDAEWLFVAANHGVGRCRRYGLTGPMRKKFSPLGSDSWWDEPETSQPYEEMLELEMQLPLVASCCHP